MDNISGTKKPPAGGGGRYQSGDASCRQGVDTTKLAEFKDARPPISLTVINAIRPNLLSKRFTLDADGALIKHAGGQLEEGVARKQEFASVTEFAKFLPGLTSNQALMHGVFAHDEARVLSKKRLAQARRAANDDLPVVSRTNGNVAWKAGPGVLMLDYDPPSDAAPLPSDALLASLYEAVPEIESAPHVWRPSASSCIFRKSDGLDLRGIRGQRVYVIVQDARDIKRAAENIQARLWLAGYGYFAVSNSGSRLERTLIDGAVFQPERLDFAGGAHCKTGLEQRLPQPKVLNPDAPYFDTTALADLTGEEHRRVDEVKKVARDAKAAAAKEAKERWVAERVAAFVASSPTPDASSVAIYGASCRAAVEDGRLFGDFEVTLKGGKTITVGEALDNPEKYHGEETLDPLEPDYDGGRPVGYLNLRAGGRPSLWSHAHGGRRYQLVRARQTIQLLVGERAEAFSRTMELLRIDGSLYEYGPLLTRLNDTSPTTVVPEWLLLHLDRTVRFEGLRKKGDEFVSVPNDAPEWLAHRIVRSPGEWGLPKLLGVGDAPTMDPKTGRIITEDGFDELSGLYLQLPPTLEPIDGHVGEVEAREAVATLWKPFELFPYADALDENNGRISRAVFLAALLTAVVRRLLPAAPALLIGATTAGSGKTLLALCIASLMSSAPSSAFGMPEGADEAEIGKILLSKAKSGDPTIVFDNISGAFKSGALCTYLTSAIYEGRTLGITEAPKVPTNAMFILTGNNPNIVGDLNRRLIRCDLDTRMEAPHKRSFDLEPLEYCRAHRLTMVRAALILLKAWHNAGRPRFTKDRTASFELWSDTVRQCVIWIGKNGWLDVGDPIDSLDSGFEADPETRKLDGLLRAWEAEFGASRHQIKDLRQFTHDHDSDLFEALDGIGVIECGKLNPRRIGRWIEQRAGRIVEGRRFVRAGTHAGTAFWRVECASVSSLVGMKGDGGISLAIARKENREICYIRGAEKIPPNPTSPTRLPSTPPWRRSTGDAE